MGKKILHVEIEMEETDPKEEDHYPWPQITKITVDGKEVKQDPEGFEGFSWLLFEAGDKVIDYEIRLTEMQG